MGESAARRCRQAGASLVEILVALSIASMVAGIGLPSLVKAMDAAAFRAGSEAVAASVPYASSRARTQRRVIVLPRDAEALPDGFELSGGPLVFLPSGACLGGELTVRGPGGRQTTVVYEAPRCAVPRLAEGTDLES